MEKPQNHEKEHEEDNIREATVGRWIYSGEVPLVDCAGWVPDLKPESIDVALQTAPRVTVKSPHHRMTLL